MTSPWLENFAVFLLVLSMGGAFWFMARSPRWERATRRFRKDRIGLISACVIGIYLFIGLLDSIQVPTEPHNQRTVLDWFFHNTPRERSYSAPLARTTYSSTRPQPLQGKHLLGTDVLGKDVLLQTLKACRTTLIIGGLTSLIYIPLGTLLGVLAGYHRRRVDDLIQYIYSTLATIPSILLLIAIIMALGKGLPQISVALGITAWVGLCRLIRGETMRQCERPYVEAARALGQNSRQIICRHILPNVMHLVMINFILGFSGFVMTESILSYLGVGVPVGTPSWGQMIDSARMELAREPAVWWNLTAAASALFLLVLALNLLGDSLRKAFDPRGTSVSR